MNGGHYICLFLGHKPAVRATEYWDAVLQRWKPVSTTHNVLICPRCGDNLNYWMLRYRA